MAMQTLSDEVLDAVDRGTIGTEMYRKLKQRYVAANIPTYVELIYPLPLETRASWKNAFDVLLEEEHHDDIRAYLLNVLPNAPMALNGDIEKYGLQVREKKLYAGYDETAAAVTATSTMTEADVDRAGRAAELMVLTEWKVLTTAEEVEAKRAEADTQLRLYAAGSLAGFELQATRYAVTVGAQRIDALAPITENGVTYRHIHVAVDPPTPSVVSRQRSARSK